MGRLSKEAVDMLATEIIRRQLWATKEETAEFLKTETGQRIHALIEIERKRLRREAQ